MIYVTHDQVEAMTLADKIVVLRKGVIEQVGAPLDLYHNPDNRFVAGFIGSPAMNFVGGVVEKAGMVRADGLLAALETGVALPGAGAKVIVGLRPQHLHVTMGDTHRVDMTEALGGVTYIHLTAENGEKLVIEAHDDTRLKMGDRVGVGFDASQAMFFEDTERGLRLR
jgi:lactose/L-arabinose transport system ATP-binding protein